MGKLADSFRDMLDEEVVTNNPQSVDNILNERHERYGMFSEQSLIGQNIKSAIRHSRNWHNLPADMKEALEMTATKMARILNGDPHYSDSWSDIAGYAQLIVDRLNGHSR